MSSDHHVNIFFESKALDHDTFAVVRFEGEEEISQPYRFVVDLVSERPDIDLDAVLGRPATLSFQRGDDGELRKIHGVLAEIELGREGQHGHYAYRAVLVPRLWMMSLTRQNQIYQNKTVPEIVEEELKGSKGKGPAGNSTFEFAADDFEFRLIGSYPQKEYLVQYAESDLDFISRLLEHVGIYYFFEQGEDRERIVFCDANVHLPSVPDESSFPYMPPSGTSSSLAESVQFLTARRRQITDKVLLKDYNYRTPQTPLQAEQDVEGEGYGVACHYGDHFKTPEEGQALAQVRAEEVLCGKALFRGAGDCHGFTAGHLFQLEEHFSDALNQEYLVTAVRHVGSQASSEATGFGEGQEGEATSYRNEFRAIPKTVTYRPARQTARPKLTGVMSARVDASGPGTRAEIDGEGRYKLVMPFDISGTAEGKATRWVRMAQPYGGGQQGMHFPLLKGTEVLWICIGGDPDRPVITGVVPNPLNKSVINAESHTRNRIKTASGITMEFQDGPGLAGQAASAAGGALSDQQQMQRLTEPVSAEARMAGAKFMVAASPMDPMERQQQQSVDYVDQHDADDDEDDDDSAPTEEKWFRVDVPDYDGKDNQSYCRLGMSTGEAPETEYPDLNDGDLKGAFDYTSHNRTEVTESNREVVVSGSSKILVGGKPSTSGTVHYADYKRNIHGKWRHTTVSYVTEDKWQYGDTESGFAGFKFLGTAGLATTAKLGGCLDMALTGNVDLGYAYKVNLQYGSKIDLIHHGQNTLDAEDHDVIGDKSISLRIKPTREKNADAPWVNLAKGATTALGAVTALTFAGRGIGLGALAVNGKVADDTADTWGTVVGFITATAAWLSGIALGVYKKGRTDDFEEHAPARIDLRKGSGTSEDRIVLNAGGRGGSTIEISKSKISFSTGTGASFELSNGRVEIITTGDVSILGKNATFAGAAAGGSTKLGSVVARTDVVGMNINMK